MGRHNVMDAVGMERLCEFIEGPVHAVGEWLCHQYEMVVGAGIWGVR